MTSVLKTDNPYAGSQVRILPQNAGEMKEIIVTDGWHVAHCRFDVSEDGHDYTIMIPTRQIKDFDRYFGLSFLFIK